MLYSLFVIYSILLSRRGNCCRCYTACLLYTVYYYHGEVTVVDVIQLVGYIQYTMRCFTFLNVGIVFNRIRSQSLLKSVCGELSYVFKLKFIIWKLKNIIQLMKWWICVVWIRKWSWICFCALFCVVFGHELSN